MTASSSATQTPKPSTTPSCRETGVGTAARLRKPSPVVAEVRMQAAPTSRLMATMASSFGFPLRSSMM